MKTAHHRHCIWLASISIAVLISGCDDELEDVVISPADLYPTKIAEAWAEFGSGNYHTAITAFREASEMEPLQSAPYLGLGWCHAMIDEVENSLNNFDVFISKEPESPDGYAAKAFVYLAQNEYEAAIAAADEALLLGGEEYVFSHIPDVQTRSLRLLIAECYYAMGQYGDAQAQIDILGPDNELDQNSRTYEEDLILEIERLKSPGSVLDDLNN